MEGRQTSAVRADAGAELRLHGARSAGAARVRLQARRS
jgi:hypothetical protein